MASNDQGSTVDLNNLPSFYLTVWPKAVEIVDGWLKQSIEFVKSEEGVIGILQPINGPCGVLAIIQALLLKQRLQEFGEIDVQKEISDEELATAFTSLIVLHARNGSCEVAKWRNDVGKDIILSTVATEEVSSFILANFNGYKSAGCLCLLLYSIVATKTQASIKDDFKQGQSGPSLIEVTADPKIWFCSSDLMTLLLLGSADGNLGAYNDLGQKRQRIEKHIGIGLLSREERQTGVPLLDEFKFPEFPVWVLHSGDHFTVMAQQNLKEESEFVFYNGLPPGGPRLSKIILKFSQVAEQSQSKIAQTDFVPIPGEIYDVVQANSEDRKVSKDFKQWNYEVILAIEDPTVTGPERPKEMLVKTFELGEAPSGRWRCAACYRTRHETFCFGENKPPDGKSVTIDKCKFCGKTKIEAQWSIWLPYESLPIDWKHRISFRYGSRLLGILSTRWIDAEIIDPKPDNIPSV